MSDPEHAPSTSDAGAGPATAAVLSDAQIRGLSDGERRELVRRLRRPREGLLASPRVLGRIRRVRLGLMTVCTAALIPWIVYLALSLPPGYEAQRWGATWIGFDIALAALMATTAVLGLLKRQLVVLTSFATGVLLVCDAWFDVMTSTPEDQVVALLSALLLELPLAALLIVGALRLVAISATEMWAMPPGGHLWQVPLLVLDVP